jgi:hypothetical protein
VVVALEVFLCIGLYVFSIYSPIVNAVAQMPSPHPYLAKWEIPQYRPGLLDPVCVGNEDFSLGYSYTVDHSLVEVQSYYEQEMAQDCTEWTIKEKETCDNSSCVWAHCTLPSATSPLATHYLSIHLISVERTATHISHSWRVSDGDFSNDICGE